MDKDDFKLFRDWVKNCEDKKVLDETLNKLVIKVLPMPDGPDKGDVQAQIKLLRHRLAELAASPPSSAPANTAPIEYTIEEIIIHKPYLFSPRYLRIGISSFFFVFSLLGLVVITMEGLAQFMPQVGCMATVAGIISGLTVYLVYSTDDQLFNALPDTDGGSTGGNT